MKCSKKPVSILAIALALTMILTACQVPEGVEIPSGLSDLTSEELEQLESYLDETEGSADDVSVESLEGTDESEAGSFSEIREEVSDPDVVVDEKPETDQAVNVEEGQTAVSGVNLPSGRDWVHKILNVEEYRKAYPDLQAAYGDNWDGYVDHYLTHGIYEGRDEGKLFDPWVYAESYPDVKAAYGDDVNAIIAHYVNHGINEGKTAGTAAGYVDMADKVSREYMMSHDVVVHGPSSRMDALMGHINTALKYGRNIEGALYPNLFVDGLNIDTFEPTIWNKGTNNEYYQSNLYAQFNFLKALDGMSLMTGNPEYSEIALEQIKFRYDTPGLVDSSGLLYAGGHSLVDVMQGKVNCQYHETKDYQVPWELMWKADPEGTKRFITAYWNGHIYDWTALTMNRHANWDTPILDAWDSEYTNPDPYVASSYHPFMSTGNDLMEAAWFLSEMTGDPKYAVWGERLLDKYIGVGNPDTMLIGEEYGSLTDDNIYGGDRFLYQFIGADFVTKSGFDFKNATMDDFKIAGANSLVRRTSLKCTAGYGPQNFTEIYRYTGNEKIYEFVKKNMLSCARYIYDPVNHLFKTPILNDGTDLNEGKDGKQLIAQRGGYYLNEGATYAENESVWEGAFISTIDVCSILKPEDADIEAEIWAAARAWGQNVDLGDLGTAMGENPNVNLLTNNKSPEDTVAVIKLYKYTGNEQYFKLACRMADNIVAAYYKPEKGLFVKSSSAPYVRFDTPEFYAVFCAEAMAQGFVNDINLDLTHGGTDSVHDGMGQADENAVFYGRAKRKIKKVAFDREEYTIAVDNLPATDFEDLNTAQESKAIRQMTAIGVMGAETDGLFHPEKVITHGELAQMVTRLYGFENYESLGINEFSANQQVIRAQMAHVIVKALQAKNPNETYNIANALYRISDADTIPAWAKDDADIATNYRLMVDLEEDTFRPNDFVTKDMAAGIFEQVARYIDISGTNRLLPEISPYNADSTRFIWETSDGSVVEVDDQGRLYTTGIGTAEIKVTSDTQFAVLTVTVAEMEDWMIKSVTIDGAPYDAFNASTLSYEVDLYKGITQMPLVEATSYCGKEVIVDTPNTIPGTIEMHVDGEDVVYRIYVTANFIDTIVDENFNHKTKTPIENITTEKFNWYINGITEKYRDDWKVVPKNWVRPDYEGYGCMRFPYVKKYNLDGKLYLYLDEDQIQTVGPEADDLLMVIQMDIAVKNMQGKENGFDIFISRRPENSQYHSAARVKITEDYRVLRKINNDSHDKSTQKIVGDGEFVTLTFVIDKKQRTFHYYYNGDLLQKDIAFFHGSNVPNIGAIYIGTPNEAQETSAEMFMDNLKIYQLTHAAYEEMMSQEVLPPPTPKPEWLSYPIDENYDSYQVGTTLMNTGKDHYEGSIAEGLYRSFSQVVNKTVIDPTAAAEDKCMELTYNPAVDYAGNFRLVLESSVIHELGSGQEDKNIVVEMDVAVGGIDGKPAGYRISLSQKTGGGYQSVCRFLLTDTEIGRYVDANNLVNPTLRTEVEKGKFVHLKMVMNKQTKQYSYYVNDELIEKGVAALYPNTPNFGTVLFTANVEDASVQDSKLYLDNLKVYIEEPKAEPTPRPTNVPVPTATPAPTATPDPYPVNETYDGYAVGTIFAETSTTKYEAKVAEGAYKANVKVVAKTEVDPNAQADDHCLEFAYNTSIETNAFINLSVENTYLYGDNYIGERYIVAEMDLAVKGQDSKNGGYRIYFSQRRGGGYRSVGRFQLNDTDLARFVSSNVLNDESKRPAVTKGEFGTLKFVVDKQTREYTYYWNGVVIETGLTALFMDTPNFGAILFQLPTEASEGVDTRLYVDNVKVYETAALPVAPTQAPTATSTPVPTQVPVATATPAPTQDPVATQTPAPATAAPATPAPTAEPTAAPTQDPYLVNMNFDGAALDTGLNALTGTHWYGKLACGNYKRYSKVVAKSTVDANAAATDYCMEFTPVTSVNVVDNPKDTTIRDLNFSLMLNAGEEISIGSPVTDGKYAVVELDMAIKGEGVKTTGYGVYLNSTSNYSVARFMVSDAGIGRVNTGSSGAIELTTPYTKGSFTHLKVVVDRETKKFTYYINGNQIETEVNALYANESSVLGHIRFRINSETLADGATQDLDTKFYIDNVKIYVTD